MNDGDSLYLAFARSRKRLEKKKKGVARFLKQAVEFWVWMAALTGHTSFLVLSTTQTQTFKRPTTDGL